MQGYQLRVVFPPVAGIPEPRADGLMIKPETLETRTIEGSWRAPHKVQDAFRTARMTNMPPQQRFRARSPRQRAGVIGARWG